MTWTYDWRSVARDGWTPAARHDQNSVCRREHRCNWRRLAEAQALELDQARAELTDLRAAKDDAEAKLASTLAQMAEYERRLFGRSTERVPPVERELRRSDANVADGQDEEKDGDSATAEDPGSTPKRRRKKARSEDAPGLRKEIVEHAVSERTRQCPHCGGTAEPIGTGKFTTEWDYVPGYFVCRRHIQEVVSCRCGKHIARAEAPLRVFDRTQYGPGLIAYLIVSKCGDAMPTFRAEKHFARLGVPIARSTLGDLIHRAAGILEPLYNALLARIAVDAHCQADETSFRLQSRPEKRGFVWTFLTGKDVAYVFSGDRSGPDPRARAWWHHRLARRGWVHGLQRGHRRRRPDALRMLEPRAPIPVSRARQDARSTRRARHDPGAVPRRA